MWQVFAGIGRSSKTDQRDERTRRRLSHASMATKSCLQQNACGFQCRLMGLPPLVATTISSRLAIFRRSLPRIIPLAPAA
jgi:hypothetical protein